MAQQARAVRTRRTILEAAAAVFDELGYEGASTTEILARSGLTRGALYFHFPSKEAIADAVVDAQSEALVPPRNKVRLQATIDLTMGFAQRLRTDVVLRAAVRLSMEQATYKTPTAAAYRGPADVILGLLTQAQESGELLPTVDPGEVTQLIVGSFTGIQLLSQVYEDRRDLPGRIAALWKYLLPSLAIPGLLPHLVADPERGAAALAEAQAAVAAQAAAAGGEDPGADADTDDRERDGGGGRAAGPAQGAAGARRVVRQAATDLAPTAQPG
jgi:AcrR family transcriptional regulator